MVRLGLLVSNLAGLSNRPDRVGLLFRPRRKAGRDSYPKIKVSRAPACARWTPNPTPLGTCCPRQHRGDLLLFSGLYRSKRLKVKSKRGLALVRRAPDFLPFTFNFLPQPCCEKFGGLASLDNPVVRQGKGRSARIFRPELRFVDSQANPVL